MQRAEPFHVRFFFYVMALLFILYTENTLSFCNPFHIYIYIYIHEFHDRLLKRRDDDLEICLSMDGDGMDGVDLNKAGYT